MRNGTPSQRQESTWSAHGREGLDVGVRRRRRPRRGSRRTVRAPGRRRPSGRIARSSFGLLVAHDSRRVADGRLHGEDGRPLQQVVLHDVADRADLLVEAAAALHAEALGHGDLDALHVVAVPDRLEEGVGEAEVRAGSGPPPCRDSGRCGRSTPRRRPSGGSRLSSVRRGEVAAERLLDDDARALRAARLVRVPRTTVANSARRDRRDSGRTRRVAAAPRASASNVRGVAVVAADVAESRRRASSNASVVDAAAVLLDAVVGASLAASSTRPDRRRHADRRAPRACRAGPSRGAPGRSSCRQGRPWRRRSTRRVAHACRPVRHWTPLLRVAAEFDAHRREQLVGERRPRRGS